MVLSRHVFRVRNHFVCAFLRIHWLVIGRWQPNSLTSLVGRGSCGLTGSTCAGSDIKIGGTNPGMGVTLAWWALLCPSVAGRGGLARRVGLPHEPAVPTRRQLMLECFGESHGLAGGLSVGASAGNPWGASFGKAIAGQTARTGK